MGRALRLAVMGVPVGGGGVPANTVAPAIEAAAVIGTEITGDDGTWTGSPTLTYQWQRYTSGAWADIALATNKNYTPVDADFGLALRLVVTADGSVTANSNSTNLTMEAPAQSLGAELLTDGDMEAVDTTAWGTYQSATLSKQTTDPHGGTRLLRIARNGFNNPAAVQQPFVVGTWYMIGGAGRSDGNATPRVSSSGGVDTWSGSVSTAWQEFWLLTFRHTNTAVFFFAITSTGTEYTEFDDTTVKKLTRNAQLTAPSANMRLDVFYTLPVSPRIGTQVWLMPRISDFAAGNYWLAMLEYTGSQWTITLYSVAAHTRTSRITAANVGATNGIRVNMNADSISLYTTANGGTDWTQRGSTISNATYQTATGVNALWTPDVTPGQIVYANPT